MVARKLKRKYGVVVLLDALGASEYSDEKIKEFLSARAEINCKYQGIREIWVNDKSGEIVRK